VGGGGFFGKRWGEVDGTTKVLPDFIFHGTELRKGTKKTFGGREGTHDQPSISLGQSKIREKKKTKEGGKEREELTVEKKGITLIQKTDSKTSTVTRTALER